MSDYRLWVNSDIQLQDYSSFNDYVNIVDKNDNFTITLDNDSDEVRNIMCSILIKNNFSIDVKKRENHEGYYIVAIKN
ncbi:MAG: hypothetical protein K0R54_2987 [Clostridiaceae bacterium]|jgi:hypothetical protein|nr:hypothetical protein [Clostridiaceae bacterium]